MLLLLSLGESVTHHILFFDLPDTIGNVFNLLEFRTDIFLQFQEFNLNWINCYLVLLLFLNVCIIWIISWQLLPILLLSKSPSLFLFLCKLLDLFFEEFLVRLHSWAPLIIHTVCLSSTTSRFNRNIRSLTSLFIRECWPGTLDFLPRILLRCLRHISRLPVKISIMVRQRLIFVFCFNILTSVTRLLQDGSSDPLLGTAGIPILQAVLIQGTKCDWRVANHRRSEPVFFELVGARTFEMGARQMGRWLSCIVGYATIWRYRVGRKLPLLLKHSLVLLQDSVRLDNSIKSRHFATINLFIFILELNLTIIIIIKSSCKSPRRDLNF